MLEEVSRLLARIGSSGSFATRRSAAAEDLNLEVQGIGRIRFPVSSTTAHKLTEVARPARHGFKDQTRLDRRVRDTWEIPKSRITIDELRWKKTLNPQLDRIRRDLGLPGGCRLKAQLHNLLVYGPGQFFAKHRDSEKADDMVGTLVVNLPSKFSGGAISIKHHEQKKLVGGSDRSLTLIAFYADCHHEVRPIKQGCRVVLTYNLVVEGEGTAAGAQTARIEALTERVREFFDTPRAPRRHSDRKLEPPDRLVYLLDHHYTQRDWPGTDSRIPMLPALRHYEKSRHAWTRDLPGPGGRARDLVLRGGKTTMTMDFDRAGATTKKTRTANTRKMPSRMAGLLKLRN